MRAWAATVHVADGARCRDSREAGLAAHEAGQGEAAVVFRDGQAVCGGEWLEDAGHGQAARLQHPGCVR